MVFSMSGRLLSDLGCLDARRGIDKLHAAFALQKVPRGLTPSETDGAEVNAAPSMGNEVQCSLPVQAKLLFKRSWCGNIWLAKTY